MSLMKISNKYVFLCIVIALTVTVLSGCTPSYIDGSYRVELSDFDSLGFKEYLTAEVVNGELTSINIGAIDRDGVTKTDNEDYRIAMQLATGTYPEEVYETLDSRYLLIAENQDPEATVDAIAGATLTSNNYAILFEELQNSIVTGETLVIIDNLIEE